MLLVSIPVTVVVAGWSGVVTRSIRLARTLISSCPDAPVDIADGVMRTAQLHTDVFTMIGVTLVASLVSILLLRRNQKLEIARLRCANRKLSATCEQKETLMRELYHRTKNNMHVIRSMLSLAASDSSSSEVADLALEVGNRIQSFALVHEKLYRADNLSRINLGEYISELVALVIGNYPAFRKRIRVACSTEEVPVGVDTAAPCGLAVSELLSNAAKHAFPVGHEGMVTLDVRRDGDTGVVLEYADDGRGVPPGFDFAEQSGAGVRTLIALVEHQLGGAIEFDGREGVAVKITFPNGLRTERG